MSRLKDLNLNLNLNDLPITEDRGGYSNKPQYDPHEIANMLIFGNRTGFDFDGRHYGEAFSNTTITYSFNQRFEFNSFDEYINYTAFTNAQIEDMKGIFSLWDEVIAIDFQFSDDDSDADIVVNGRDDAGQGIWGYAYSGIEGGQRVNPTQDVYNKAQTSIWVYEDSSDSFDFDGSNSFNVLALMHEIGHALGLDHPGNYNASSGEAAPTYENSAEFAQDDYITTIMSYFNPYVARGTGLFVESEDTFSGVPEGSLFQVPGLSAKPTSPMVYDILAMQLLYGADMATRTGNNVYGATVANGGTDGFGDGVPYYSIWDAGGVDTLDFSRYTENQHIVLLQGAYSSVAGYYSNVGIAFGTVIENASSGAGDDFIVGNSSDNVIDGGDGVDAFVLNATPSDVTFSKASNGHVTVKSAGTGTDTLENIEFIRIGESTYVYIIPEPLTSANYDLRANTDARFVDVYVSNVYQNTLLKSGYILEAQGLQNGTDVAFGDLTTVNQLFNDANNAKSFNLSSLEFAENVTNVNIGEITLADGTDLSGYTLAVTFTRSFTDNREAPTVSSSDFAVQQENGKYYLRYVGTALDFEKFDGLLGNGGIEVSITGTKGSETFNNHFVIVVTNANDAPEQVNGSIIQNVSQLQSGGKLHLDSAGEAYVRFSIVDQDRGENYTISVSDTRFEVVNHPVEGYILKLKDGQRLNDNDLKTFMVNLTFTDSFGHQTYEAFEIKTESTLIERSEEPQVEINPDLLNDNGVIRFDELTVIHDSAIARIVLPESWTLNAATSTVTSTYSGLVLELEDRSGEWIVIAKGGAVIDFESLADGTFDITLNISSTNADGTPVTTTEIFQVNVNDINEAPGLTLDTQGQTLSFAEHGSGGHVLAKVSTSDQDANDTATYSVSDDRFKVVSDGNGGQELRAKAGAAFDFETEPSLDVIVTVTDKGGLTDSETLTVTITDVNEAPALQLTSSVTSIIENESVSLDLATVTTVDPDANATITYSVSDDRFEVVDKGSGAGGFVLRVKSNVTFDHEAGDTVTVKVTATDGAGLADSQDFVLTVTDANEAPQPVVDTGGRAVTVVENGLNDHVLATLTAIDPDANDEHTYAVSDNRFEVVDSGSSMIVRAKAGAAFDFETEPSINLDVTATDQAGLSNTTSLIINVANTNEAPQLRLSASTGSLIENMRSGDILATITATDPDANDTIAYSVSDDRFEIVSNNGAMVLKLKANTTFDREVDSSVNVMVTATDEAGLSSSQTFNLAIGDVNDNSPDVDINRSVNTIKQGEVGGNDIVIASFTISDKDTVGTFQAPELQFRDEFGRDVQDDMKGKYTLMKRSGSDNIYDVKLKANEVINLGQISLLIITAIASDGANASDSRASSVIVNVGKDNKDRESASDFKMVVPGENVVFDNQFIDVYNHVMGESRALANLSIVDDNSSMENLWTITVNGASNSPLFTIVDGVIQYNGGGTSGSVYRITITLQDNPEIGPVQRSYAVFLIEDEQVASEDGDNIKMFSEGDDQFVFDGFSNAANFSKGKDEVFSVNGEIQANMGDDDDTFIGAGNRLSVDGGNDNDRIITLSGNNVLEGGSGDDIVVGGMGSDTISGGEGNDVLAGDVSALPFFGNDRLTGGAGNDILKGGGGKDTFVFSVNEGNDVIGNFDALAAWGGSNLSPNITGADFDLDDDRLEFNGFGFTNRADVIDQFSQNGATAVFSNDNTMVTIHLDNGNQSTYQSFLDNVNITADNINLVVA